MNGIFFGMGFIRLIGLGKAGEFRQEGHEGLEGGAGPNDQIFQIN
jgi:hypothetical protein